MIPKSRKVNRIHDFGELQEGLDKLQLQSDMCLMKFNSDRYNIRMEKDEHRPNYEYTLGGKVLMESNFEKGKRKVDN